MNQAGRIGPSRKEITAMSKQNTEQEGRSSVTWATQEEWVRSRVQEAIQDVLEEEVAELLGRAKSQRRRPVDAAPGYRNGYGKPRRLTLSGGAITVRRPRVRRLEQRFESRILKLLGSTWTRLLALLLPAKTRKFTWIT
jgi:transposase-like protein